MQPADGRVGPETAALVNRHVGSRIRLRRWALEMTQAELGAIVGVRYQQIQKYETAKNRVSAGRLWNISIALNQPIAWFFEGAATIELDQAYTD